MASAQDIVSQLSRLHPGSFSTDLERIHALNEARRLFDRLQKPAERIMTITRTEPVTLIALKIAIDMDMFSHLQNGPMDSAAAGAAIGADPLLVSRIFRMLGSQDILHEKDVDTFENSNFSSSLIDPTGLQNGVRHFYDLGLPQLAKLPSQIKGKGWQSPSDCSAPPFADVMRPDQGHTNFWSWLQSHPTASKHFNCFLGSMRTAGLQSWTSAYPISEKLLLGYDKTTALLVDVGGGDGSNLQAFSDLLPEEYKGATLILQEQAHVVNAVKSSLSKITNLAQLQVHDFFQPQPPTCRGARAYVLGHILHDWPDKQALSILAHIKSAMTPAYSKVLLHEFVVPERVRNMSPRIPTMDLSMMSHFASMERTRAQWETLLLRAGLRITDVFPGGQGDGHGLIEAVLDE